MCIPLLPSDKIVAMFNYLKETLPNLPESKKRRINILLRYYQRYWLGPGPPRGRAGGAIAQGTVVLGGPVKFLNKVISS